MIKISSRHKCNIRLYIAYVKTGKTFHFTVWKHATCHARENQRISNINIACIHSSTLNLFFFLSSNWKKKKKYTQSTNSIHIERIKSPSRSSTILFSSFNEGSTILFSSFNGRTKRNRTFYIYTENFPGRNAALHIELSIDPRHWIHSRPRITSPRNNRQLGSNPHFNF